MANRKRKENPVREWISDNLRYLLLILILIIAALAAFLIYREIADRRSRAGSGTEAVVEETTQTAASSAAEATSVSTQSTEIVTATPTATPTPTEEPTPTPMPDVELTEMNPGANEVAEAFIYSRQEAGVSYYESTHVQTFKGPKEGSYVAYVDYDCKYDYADYDGLVPRLTRMYLAPDETGALHEVPESEITPEENEYLTAVDQSEPVQALIQEVLGRYNEIMDANPGLADYIAGLG